MDFIRKNREEHKTQSQKKVCGKCGSIHEYGRCPAYGEQCNQCKKMNHFAKACEIRTVKQVEIEEGEMFVGPVVKVHSLNKETWTELLEVNDRKIEFKLDTGAEVNILPISELKNFAHNEMRKTNMMLEAFGGEKIKPLGQVNLNIKMREKQYTIDFVVVNGLVKPILGLKACKRLGLILRIDLGSDVEQFQSDTDS